MLWPLASTLGSMHGIGSSDRCRKDFVFYLHEISEGFKQNRNMTRPGFDQLGLLSATGRQGDQSSSPESRLGATRRWGEGVLQAGGGKKQRICPGGSVGERIILIGQGCRFDPWSRHIQEINQLMRK